MEWLVNLFMGQGTAHSLLLLALTMACGLLLAKIKIAGISLGVTFILFVGILFAELGMKVNHDILHFFQEFGLILFVFSIGLQVGPSFFENFKSGGGKLNAMAVAIVLLGAGTTIALHFITGLKMPTMVGIMSGAITNTPGLGAAQQTVTDMMGESETSIGQGYAVAYPLGVLGIIFSIMTVRWFFKVNLHKEIEKAHNVDGSNEDMPTPLSLVVNNPSIYGKTVYELSQLLKGYHFVVSRIFHASTQEITTVGGNTVLQEGDRIFIITKDECVNAITTMVGYVIDMDRNQWIPTRSEFSAHRFVMTNRANCGKTIAQMNLRATYGVTVTRVERTGLEFVATPGLRLQYGDNITVVGSEAALKSVEPLIGNKSKHLNAPNLIAIFLGIALGVIVGSIPFLFPGIPQPIKLGLAGGPLIVAILLSRFGHKYHLITYTTDSANLMLREIGICIFLACVGLNAGNGFVDTLVNHGGFVWVGYGVIITLLPLIIVGCFARGVLKLNYLTIAGTIAGSTTDPPALAYANSLSSSSASQVAYATVYPLTMFLRVITAQVLILFF